MNNISPLFRETAQTDEKHEANVENWNKKTGNYSISIDKFIKGSSEHLLLVYNKNLVQFPVKFVHNHPWKQGF